MSRMTYERALGIVAERTYFNRRDIRQKNVQRRNQVVDLYGVPYYARSNDENEATFYISVSPDMIYYNRFQFRLAVHEAGESMFHIYIDDLEITDYLKEQQGISEDESLIDGEGLYPIDLNNSDPETADLTQEDDDFYDILDVAQAIQAIADTKTTQEEKDEWENKRAKMLKAGWKRIRVTSGEPFELTMFLYLKYSHTNR